MNILYKTSIILSFCESFFVNLTIELVFCAILLNILRLSLFIFLLCVLTALCNEDANGNVPLGKSCNRYWQCQGGYPRLQRCPAMLVFDRRSLR